MNFPEMPADVQIALGRLFRMMSRPTQPGDVDTFYKIREIVLQSAPEVPNPYVMSYARDHRKGAQGQN